MHCKKKGHGNFTNPYRNFTIFSNFAKKIGKIAKKVGKITERNGKITIKISKITINW